MTTDQRKVFTLRVSTGRHGKTLRTIGADLRAVFTEANVQHNELRFELVVRAPPELEEHIRAWFAVMLETNQ